jgi:hypothetical protein
MSKQYFVFTKADNIDKMQTGLSDYTDIDFQLRQHNLDIKYDVYDSKIRRIN